MNTHSRTVLKSKSLIRNYNSIAIFCLAGACTLWCDIGLGEMGIEPLQENSVVHLIIFTFLYGQTVLLFHILVLQEYWVHAESRIPLKQVLGALELLHFPLVLI